MTRRPPPTAPDPTAAIDRSLKALARRVPSAEKFRLAGQEADDPRRIRTDDVAVNLPEFRADQVFLEVDGAGAVRHAFYFEYQLQPDRRQVPGWLLKYAGLTAQLDVPVVLVVVYLTQGRYRRFPRSYTAQVGTLRSEFRFDTVRLWEHAPQIRSGELAELAPLLALCEENPTEAVLREERELILGLPVSRGVKAEMLAVAVTVGGRYFPRSLLQTVFREELQMLREASIIEEWVAEAAEAAEERGMEKGRVENARAMLLRLLRAKFTDLPEGVVARVEREGPEWCQEMAERLLTATSLADIGL